MKNVHVRYIVACEDTVEHKLNQVDFIGVFEGKYLSEIPTKYEFSVVISFKYITQVESVPEVSIRLINPAGMVMAKELLVKLNAQKDINERERIISVITIHLPNFPINEEGIYSFQVLKENELIAEQSVLFELEEVK